MTPIHHRSTAQAEAMPTAFRESREDVAGILKDNMEEDHKDLKAVVMPLSPAALESGKKAKVVDDLDDDDDDDDYKKQ